MTQTSDLSPLTDPFSLGPPIIVVDEDEAEDEAAEPAEEPDQS